MLDWLSAHKTAVGLLLSIVGATATVLIFENSFELDWYFAIPAGVVAYVTMPIMWSILLDYFVSRYRR